jgi:uncharacterized membrane protein (UPF0127 family)
METRTAPTAAPFSGVRLPAAPPDREPPRAGPVASPASGVRSVVARNVDTGEILAGNVRIADTRVTRALGLMGRRALAPGEALWIVPSRGVHTWWMRFTIDILALDADGRIVDLVPDLRPWRVRLPRPGTAGVLEMRAGTLGRSATRLGHRIVFEPFERGNEA